VEESVVKWVYNGWREPTGGFSVGDVTEEAAGDGNGRGLMGETFAAIVDWHIVAADEATLATGGALGLGTIALAVLDGAVVALCVCPFDVVAWEG
jgi:hypothetical protein